MPNIPNSPHSILITANLNLSWPSLPFASNHTVTTRTSMSTATQDPLHKPRCLAIMSPLFHLTVPFKLCFLTLNQYSVSYTITVYQGQGLLQYW